MKGDQIEKQEMDVETPENSKQESAWNQDKNEDHEFEKNNKTLTFTTHRYVGAGRGDVVVSRSNVLDDHVKEQMKKAQDEDQIIDDDLVASRKNALKGEDVIDTHEKM